MSDFLDVLVRDAKATIDSGYYDYFQKPASQPKVSLKKAIIECKQTPIITEIKTASPSLGTIRSNIKPNQIAQAMQKGGAVGISVLTEPKHFKGSLQTLSQAREAVNLPLLMKDIVIVPEQVEAAANLGANAVLLILALFKRGCCEVDVDKMIAFVHARGLEVLLETHTPDEFQSAITTDADLIGINNRNLATLKIDLNTTKQILEKHKSHGKTVISESGITSKADLQFLKGCGANAFLVGSSIMLTENVEEKVREFVET
ncbi:MAG: indole-3-glycerol-phosphate synthase [Candidatus Bathyarchaeota archaeon]|nr:indole-3-glycerol-phosphate synthase [Candidatus Bathyarchaeota archaeon]